MENITEDMIRNYSKMRNIVTANFEDTLGEEEYQLKRVARILDALECLEKITDRKGDKLWKK